MNTFLLNSHTCGSVYTLYLILPVIIFLMLNNKTLGLGLLLLPCYRCCIRKLNHLEKGKMLVAFLQLHSVLLKRLQLAQGW